MPPDPPSGSRLQHLRAPPLMLPLLRHCSYGKIGFSCATHELWNSLPQNIQSSASVSIFKSLLKTWFFKLAYPKIFPVRTKMANKEKN